MDWGERKKGERISYEEEGPWNVVMLEVEVVDEEDDDDGDDEGGEPLA